MNTTQVQKENEEKEVHWCEKPYTLPIIEEDYKLKRLWVMGALKFADEVLKRYNKTIILLNAVVPAPGFVYIEKMDWCAVEALLKKTEFKSFIGHEGTVNVINEKLHDVRITTFRGIYEPKHGDVALVFRLTGSGARPQGDVKSLKPEDIEILAVFYLQI